jgi:hypothetical protein
VLLDTRVGDVDVDEVDARLSSYRDSELGAEDEWLIWPTESGLAEILVVTFSLLTFTKSWSEEYGWKLRTWSSLLLDNGVSSEGLVINLLSHGLTAIHRSNQLHPEMFLSCLWCLGEVTDLLVLDMGLAENLGCWKQEIQHTQRTIILHIQTLKRFKCQLIHMNHFPGSFN